MKTETHTPTPKEALQYMRGYVGAVNLEHNDTMKLNFPVLARAANSHEVLIKALESLSVAVGEIPASSGYYKIVPLLKSAESALKLAKGEA